MKFIHPGMTLKNPKSRNDCFLTTPNNVVTVLASEALPEGAAKRCPERKSCKNLALGAIKQG